MNVGIPLHAAPVAGRLASMDLTFELHFTVPLFDLPERRAELLRALHDALPGPFTFDSDDVELSQGSALSDFQVTVGVLYGNAKISISPELLGMSFSALSRMALLHPSRLVIESAYAAVNHATQNAEVNFSSIGAFLRVDLEQETSVRDHLNNVCQSRLFDFSGFGDTLQYHEIKFEMRDENDSWRISCHAHGELEQESRLGLSVFALYDEDGTLDGLENHTNHLERAVTDLLPQLGVSLQ